MTVCLEFEVETARPFIDRAGQQHPSLIDTAHRVDAVFGMVNIPNAVWIDEDGVIVRPAEPAWPAARSPRPPTTELPEEIRTRIKRWPPLRVNAGTNHERYAGALRDWVDRGAASAFALDPDAVVARSQPCPLSTSEAAAHFELAEHHWQAGHRELAFVHFRAAHRLHPENWTFKRQAWALISSEQTNGHALQVPLDGEDWPFDSDFRTDVDLLGDGDYYPTTL